MSSNRAYTTYRVPSYFVIYLHRCDLLHIKPVMIRLSTSDRDKETFQTRNTFQIAPITENTVMSYISVPN
jgi:hypothetical protein